jgi:hypothetical protein
MRSSALLNSILCSSCARPVLILWFPYKDANRISCTGKELLTILKGLRICQGG